MATEKQYETKRAVGTIVLENDVPVKFKFELKDPKYNIVYQRAPFGVIEISADSPLDFYLARELANFCYEVFINASVSTASIGAECCKLVGAVPIATTTVIPPPPKQQQGCKTVLELFTQLGWVGDHAATGSVVFVYVDPGALMTTKNSIAFNQSVIKSPPPK